MHIFRQALRTQEFTLTAELALDAQSNGASLIAQAQAMAQHVDAIQVPDIPTDRVHMSVLAAAAILLNEGIDPVVHMNCRDRNRIALLSDLLGASALGVSSLLLMRGREIPESTRPRVKSVYDWGGRRLIEAASALEESDFMIGSIATVFKPDRDWKPEQLIEKADAGVKFVQTQLCFDIDLLRHYMARLVDEKIVQRVNIIVGLAPVSSADMAQVLGKTLRGAVMPAKVVKRLRQATDPEQEGITICAELLQQVSEIPGTSGVNLICLGDPEAVAEAVRQSGVRG